MYCKIFERVCRESLGEIQFEKNDGKKGEGARSSKNPWVE
jgi:hypothetical protein